MQLPPLSHGTLLRRYKRFLADIRLPDGEEITIHCPNTGAMTGCATAGDTVWFSSHNNPKRKYAHTWELTQTAGGDFICVNTLRANQLVYEALQNGWIAPLADYTHIAPEVKYGTENSRVDFLLTLQNQPDCFVEVKSTTLLTENGVGMFPDAKTVRGQKHLRELAQISVTGARAVIFFAVLHTGIRQFEVARHIDPQYGKWFDFARENGVEALIYRMDIQFAHGVPSALILNQALEK